MRTSSRIKMTKTERWIQIFAIAAGGLGILILVVFGILLFLAGDWPNTSFNASRTGQIGDFIGGVTGSLFSLAAGLLFYLTLTLQRKEFRNSLKELKQSRRALKLSAMHQEATVSVMRQEKEFTVCLHAIQNTVQKVERFSYYQHQGLSAIEVVVRKWESLFEDLPLTRGSGMFRGLRTTEKLFTGFNQLDELNIYMYWVLHAINRKDLAKDDRQYLNSLIIPVIRDVDKAQSALRRILDQMELVLANDDGQLEFLNIDRKVLQHYEKDMKTLYDRRVPVESETIPQNSKFV